MLLNSNQHDSVTVLYSHKVCEYKNTIQQAFVVADELDDSSCYSNLVILSLLKKQKKKTKIPLNVCFTFFTSFMIFFFFERTCNIVKVSLQKWKTEIFQNSQIYNLSLDFLKNEECKAEKSNLSKNTCKNCNILSVHLYLSTTQTVFLVTENGGF